MAGRFSSSGIIKLQAPLLCALSGAMVLALAQALIVQARHGLPWINHDAALYLYIATKVANGARLYVDWNETNPPPIHLVSLAVVLLSRFWDVRITLLYNGFVIFIALLGVHSLYRTTVSLQRPLLTLNLIAAEFIALIWVSYVPGGDFDFGQREHLFSLLFMPYCLWKIFSDKGALEVAQFPPTAFILGFFAMLKPQFAAMVAFTEYACFRPSREARLNRNWVLLGMAAPILILLFCYFRSFIALFTAAIPNYFNYYDSFNASFVTFLFGRINFGLMAQCLVAIAAGWACWKRGAVSGRALCISAILIVVNYGALLAQRKYFTYHFIPVFDLNLMLSIYFVSLLLKNIAWRVLGGGLLCVFVVMGLGHFRRSLRSPPLNNMLMSAKFTRFDKVMYVATSVRHVRVALERNLNLVGPWVHYFTLPGILRQSGARREAAIAELRENILESIERERPDYIVFSSDHWGLADSMYDTFTGSLGIVMPSAYKRITASGPNACDAWGCAVAFRRTARS